MAPLQLRTVNLTDVSNPDPDLLREELEALAHRLPRRLEADPERMETGLARLVLTLIEFLRQVLEHQAVRKMEAGTLTEEEEERLGVAFLRLKERMTELRQSLGVSEEDMNVDLGPLGRLL